MDNIVTCALSADAHDQDSAAAVTGDNHSQTTGFGYIGLDLVARQAVASPTNKLQWVVAVIYATDPDAIRFRGESCGALIVDFGGVGHDLQADLLAGQVFRSLMLKRDPGRTLKFIKHVVE